MNEHPAYKQIGMNLPNPYKGLECPNCSKWGVEIGELPIFECPHCHEEFTEDDICPECEKLVKGSCYYCKMD